MIESQLLEPRATPVVQMEHQMELEHSQDSVDKELHSIQSENEEKIDTLMTPAIIENDLLQDLLEVYSFLKYFRKKLDLQKHTFQQLYIAFCFEGEDHMMLVNQLFETLIGKILNHIQSRSQKKERCNGESIEIVVVLNTMNFPKILKDIVFKVIWRKVMVDLLVCFEGVYEDKDLLSKVFLEHPDRVFEQFSCSLKLKAFRKLIDILIREKILDFQQSEISQNLKEFNQKKQSLQKQKQELEVQRKQLEMSIIKFESGSKKEFQLLHQLQTVKSQLEGMDKKLDIVE